MLERLVALGLAQYQRVSVGFSSHAVLQVPNGRMIAITSVEIEPWLYVQPSGTAVDEAVYYAKSYARDDYITQQQKLESQADWQLRVLADKKVSHAFTVRPNIRYDASPDSLEADAYTFQRTIEVHQRRFDTLIFCRETCLLMFAVLGLVADTIGTTTQAYNQTYNKDLNPFYGMNGTTDPVNYQTVLLQGPPADIYLPFTKQDTITLPGSYVPGQTSLQDVVIYPLGSGLNPTYEGDASGPTAAILHNLPMLNIEYVIFNAGTSTQNGYFSPEILKALGWS